MNIRSMYSVPAERFCSTRIYLNICSPYGLEGTPCISRRLLQRDIAMDSADAEEIQGRMMGSYKNSKCILSR